MPLLRLFPLLLALLAPAAFADGTYQVEVILFRQAPAVDASQPAPDDWAAGATPLSSEAARALDSQAAKLTAGKGYQVLMHKAWQQNIGATPSKVAVSAGSEQLGHFPVEGTLSLSQVRFVDVEADFWVNQFDGQNLIAASEHLKQTSRLKIGELTYLDHSSLGLLVRVSPL
ncbi:MULTISPECIES: CsiV family protein [Pseudomonas]|uniref:Peptidoglycan-binding protein, CsiV n=1 Tax=Pseudomonas kuykendallii TaxID=1007099 RepID=A0A2W5CTF6_9PSED|nr:MULTISPECIES: CsiV family protein [Pseudomonas]PZP22865.1 MAG: hypothetical protein DI599_13935 [Pseudomonas kuykendallii]